MLFYRRCERPAWNAMIYFRTWLLYHHMPADMTIFGKLSMWQSVGLVLIGAWPSWYLRASFFTLIFVCILPDSEEFQLVRFILSLKGSAFISGVINAIKCAVQLWARWAIELGDAADRDHDVHLLIADGVIERPCSACHCCPGCCGPCDCACSDCCY